MFVTYIPEASESNENNNNQKKATSKQRRKRATLNTKNSKNGSESGRRNKNSNTFKNNKNNNNKFTNEEKYDYVSNNDLGRSSTEQSMTVTEARNEQVFEQGGPRKRGSDSFGSLRALSGHITLPKIPKSTWNSIISKRSMLNENVFLHNNAQFSKGLGYLKNTKQRISKIRIDLMDGIIKTSVMHYCSYF